MDAQIKRRPPPADPLGMGPVRCHAIAPLVLVPVLGMALGCTAIPMIPRPPGDDWTTGLPRYLAVARACLDAAPLAVREVVSAWSLGGGRAAARLRYPDGRRFDCVAQGLPIGAEGAEDEAATIRVASVEPVRGPLRPGEGRTVFTLIDEGPPGGNPCYEHERVEEPTTGVVVGYLSRDTCPPPGTGRRLW